MVAKQYPSTSTAPLRPSKRFRSGTLGATWGGTALVVVGLCFGGCMLDRTGGALAVGGAGGTATSTSSGQAGMGGDGGGGQGGTGGSEQPCQQAGECPGTDTDCGHRTCVEGVCGFQDHPLGTSCDDNGGDACDGAGVCKKNNGTACASEAECLSGHCPDSVCCEVACDGPCEACDLTPFEGTCTPHGVATDPDQECNDGVCNGAGACASGAMLWGYQYTAAGNTDEFGWDVAVDGSGDVIINGDMLGPVDFGGGPLPYGGNRDFFVAKLNSTGAHLWSKGFGTAGDQAVWGLAVDAAGGVFVSGHFKGDLTVNNTITATGGKFDVFVAKLDSAGNGLWAKHFDDSNSDTDDLAFDLAIDGNGDLIVVGHFQGTIDFGGTILTTLDKRDIFVAKLDATTGDPLWSTAYGGTEQDLCLAVAVDSQNDLFITGSYKTALDLGGGLTSNGENLYIAKLAGANGAELWGAGYGDNTYQSGYGLAVDWADAVVVVGEMDGEMDFGNGTILTSAGGADGFLAKLDGSGNVLEAISFGGDGDQVGRGVAVDSYDQIVVTGDFLVEINFGLGVIAADDGWNVFLAKLDGQLNPVYSHGYQGSGDEQHRGVAIHPSGDIFTTGSFDGTIDLGGGPLTASGFDVLFAIFDQ